MRYYRKGLNAGKLKFTQGTAMKEAKLWKRILHEGIQARSNWDCASLAHDILVSPIIVDARPSLRKEHNESVFSRLSFPFDKFWLEGPADNPNGDHSNWRWGAYVYLKRGEEFFSVSFDGVMTSGAKPQSCGGFDFKTDVQGNPIIGSHRARVNTDAAEELGWEQAAEMAKLLYSPVCDTLMMLGCKNVSLAPKDNDPKQVRIATKRHGTNALGYRYHVLVVRPPGARSDAPAQEIGMMPRHVCRGHFAEYGPEFNKGLLFGKYAGRFYVPPHLKGDKKNGVVEKDYAIAAS